MANDRKHERRLKQIIRRAAAKRASEREEFEKTLDQFRGFLNEANVDLQSLKSEHQRLSDQVEACIDDGK